MAWPPPPPRRRSMDQASLMALKRLFPKKTFQDLLDPLSPDVPGIDMCCEDNHYLHVHIYIYMYIVDDVESQPILHIWHMLTVDICWHMSTYVYTSIEAIVLYQVIFAHVTVECITTLLIYNDLSYWDLCFCWSIVYRFSHCWSNINLNLINVYIYIYVYIYVYIYICVYIYIHIEQLFV